MSSGVKSTIITATSNGTAIQLSINAVAAVCLTIPSYDGAVCGLWYHASTGELNLSIFTRDVISDRIDMEYIHKGEQFRVLYVD